MQQHKDVSANTRTYCEFKNFAHLRHYGDYEKKKYALIIDIKVQLHLIEVVKIDEKPHFLKPNYEVIPC